MSTTHEAISLTKTGQVSQAGADVNGDPSMDPAFVAAREVFEQWTQDGLGIDIGSLESDDLVKRMLEAASNAVSPTTPNDNGSPA